MAEPRFTFNGPGVYVFSSVRDTTASNTFVFDLKNNTNGFIYIYVYGDVFMNKLAVNFPNGGNASRVYMEVHGTGSTSSDGATAWNYSPSATGNGQNQQWFGTVWAPYGAVKVGGTKASVTGALWSGTQVNLSGTVTFNYLPLVCVNPDANAGNDVEINCPATTATLNGSSFTSGVAFSWTAINGGHIVSGANTSSPVVDKAGKYVLAVSTVLGGCTTTDTVVVTSNPCIQPTYPPSSTGKISTPLGSELTSLALNGVGAVDPSKAGDSVFRVTSDGFVYIEVVAIQGQYDALKALLISLGMSDFIDNGPNSLIISGKFPIANLLQLPKYGTQPDDPAFPEPAHLHHATIPCDPNKGSGKLGWR
jgi:hypothetical protein